MNYNYLMKKNGSCHPKKNDKQKCFFLHFFWMMMLPQRTFLSKKTLLLLQVELNISKEFFFHNKKNEKPKYYIIIIFLFCREPETSTLRESNDFESPQPCCSLKNEETNSTLGVNPTKL